MIELKFKECRPLNINIICDGERIIYDKIKMFIFNKS